MGLLRRIKRWWHLRDPEIRWIVEVGVEEVPEEVNPAPEPMEPPFTHVSRTVDYMSYLIENPELLQSLFMATKNYVRTKYRVQGGLGSLRPLLRMPGIVEHISLLMMQGDNMSATILANHGVVVAANAVETSTGRMTYGLEAVKTVESSPGEYMVTVVRLRDHMYRWVDYEFTVYIQGIDRQHQYLVTTLNNLYRHLLAGSPRKILDDTLNALAEYTKFHFRSEEKLFDKYGYPRAEGHRRQHNSFVRKVDEFMEKYQANEAKLTIDVLHFLAEWVRNHILVSDRDFGEWFRKQGVPIISDIK